MTPKRARAQNRMDTAVKTVTIFTSLDTVRIVLDVLEESIPDVSTIDGQ